MGRHRVGQAQHSQQSPEAADYLRHQEAVADRHPEGTSILAGRQTHRLLEVGFSSQAREALVQLDAQERAAGLGIAALVEGAQERP